jgi:hypothetical protein
MSTISRNREISQQPQDLEPGDAPDITDTRPIQTFRDLDALDSGYGGVQWRGHLSGAHPDDGIDPVPSYAYANDSTSPDDPVSRPGEDIDIKQPGNRNPDPIVPLPGPELNPPSSGSGSGGGGGGGEPGAGPVDNPPPVTPPPPVEVAKTDHRKETDFTKSRPVDQPGEVKDPNKAAETRLKASVTEQPKFVNGRLTNTPTKVQIEIGTNYRDLNDKSKPSKDTPGKTLGEHEDLHKQDLEDYVSRNPPPESRFREGMTKAEYEAEVVRYQGALDSWCERGLNETHARRDAAKPTTQD